MNILFINGKFYTQPLTGVQRFAREMLNALDEKLDSELGQHSSQFILIIPDIKTLSIPNFRHIRVVRSKVLFSLFFWEQIILPLLTCGRPLLNFSGSAPLLKMSQVCTFHDAAIFDVPYAYTKLFTTWYKLLFWIQARICMGIITVSKFSKARLEAVLKIRPDRICVVYNGADHFAKISPKSEMPEKISKPFFLAVGSANPSKNFPRLIEAFKMAKLKMGDGISLVVVGGINDDIFSTKNQKDISQVIKTGRISDEDLKTLYQHADAFIFPSLYEGFGIPLLEAMVCGCPILASDAASVPEVCEASALFFDPNNTFSISEAMVRFAGSPRIALELKSNGLIRVQEFSWAKSVDQLLDSLEHFKIINR